MPVPFPRPPAPDAYPATRADDVVDHYHGVAVPDPYRWLEDDTSDETAAWVAAQNRVTDAWLAQLPFRDALRDRIRALVNYPRVGQPAERAGWLLVAKNDGLQNQAVWYLQRGVDGEPVVLLDPNAMSDDGTTRVGQLAIDRAGAHVAYTISEAGSDWQEIRIKRLPTREDLPDRIRWVKISDIAWYGDGFFYSRYPDPDDPARQFSDANADHQVWYHRLGTPQSDDRLVYHDAEHPQRFHVLSTTEDERLAILTVSDRGTGHDGNAVLVLDLAERAADDDAPYTFQPVWTSFADQLHVLDEAHGRLLVHTNRGAPNGRIVAIDPAHPDDDAEWTDVVAEGPEPIDGAATGGGRLFVTWLHDVTTRAASFALDGTDRRDLTLPGIGTAVGFGGERDATHLYFTFTSFTAPPTVYRFDVVTGDTTPFSEPQLPFDPSRFTTTQVFVTSRDGTRVPLFLVHRTGLPLDGTAPTILYGYGGFNVTLSPSFSAARVAWLEQGGVFAQACLRGGGEYGEAWHQGGMKTRKQHVFDDAIACAEWLVANGWTSAERLAIQGGSNGGLLVGACMTQRPELFRVALPAVGVMDMLRFHRFTIGWNWIADYGSSDDPDEFRALYAYSPLHRLRDGVAYPATLVTTADHDDRVVPAHSFKFAARLQAAHAGELPVLIRIEVKSGHGASSLTKAIEETADVFAFTLANMGLRPVFEAASA